MTKISLYPEISTPDIDDLLIGTDVENSNATKNFTIQSVIDLTPIPTLQDVTDSGNTTTVDLIVNSIKVGRGGSSISSNTAIGVNTLQNNTTGYANTANGANALLSNTTGGNNTANGVYALYNNTTGNNNTANGVNALFSNTSGSENVVFGNSTLYSNTTGFGNTAIGISALYNNIGGTGNTAIGYYALNSNTGYSNIVGLGNSAQVTGDFQIQLGTASNTTYVYGTVQNRSDLRDKAEVRDTILGLDFISKLRPVDYKWDMREDYKTEMPSPLSEDSTEEEKDAHKIIMDEWLESVKLDNLTHDGTHTRNRYHHGLIAQEVQDLGIDFGGFQDHKINGGQDVLSIGYDELIAPMIKAIQELKAEIELLKSK